MTQTFIYPEISFPNGVWTGDISSTSVVLSTRVNVIDSKIESVPLVVQVSITSIFNNCVSPVISKNIMVYRDSINYRKQPGNYVAKVEISDLQPDTAYFFRFVSPTNAYSAVGYFVTLPDKNSDLPITFAVISCMNTRPFDPTNGIKIDGKIKFIHFNGDTVYCDLLSGNYFDPDSICGSETKLAYYRNLYQNLHSPDYAGQSMMEIFNRIPFFYSWDDHEVSDNYAGRYHNCDPEKAIQISDYVPIRFVENLKRIGYRAFIEYAAIPTKFHDENDITSDPEFNINRIFRKVKINLGVENIIIDARQYRDAQYYIPHDINFPLVPILPPINPSDPQGPSITLEILLTQFGPLSLALRELQQNQPEIFARLFGPPGYQPIPLREQNITMLGCLQKEWLKKQLLESESAFKFIINGVTFSSIYFNIYDSWEGYYRERQEIIDFIVENKIQGVIFLTGDLHAGMINRITPSNSEIPIWEIVTGPIGQFTLGYSVIQVSGLVGSDVLLYGMLNAFLASPEHGGQPQYTANSLRFLTINTPNYMRVEYLGNNLVNISLRDGKGSIIIDERGRQGVITLTSTGLEI